MATTRPETILGDTAVAVHPDDDRYQHLSGATCLVPMLKRTIPVIIGGAAASAFARHREVTVGATTQADRFGRFERSFGIRVAVDANAVTGVCKDGVLTVTLPKTPEARPRQVQITAA